MTQSRYKKTIHLPKTSFSMKANLLQKEPQIQKRWAKIDLYAKLREARAGAETFMLHDGPPYPTGDIHVGTAMNKVVKDIVVRTKSMEGFDAPYRPGWDCHGLPIEFQVMKEIRAAGEEPSKMEIRQRCKKYAEKYLKIHRKQFIAFGIGGEWAEPYLTFLPEYESGVLSVFAEMVGRGYIYRAKKPIHWCCDCQTALAEAELDYETKTSPSIHVSFTLAALPQDKGPGAGSLLKPLADVGDLQIMIWTTTPWTIPANMAIAVNERFEYAAVRFETPDKGLKPLAQVSIIAAEKVNDVMEAIGATSHEILTTVKGAALVGLEYRHPFIERTSKILSAEFVSLEEGTGCVHIAPGHGADDYLLGLAHGLEVYSPVDSEGRYTSEFPLMEGVQVYDANDKLCDLMAERSALAARTTVSHSYPHCWRCHNPVIFRATEQWFVRIDHDDLRQKALAQVDEVRWIPAWGQARIRSMIADRPDWCISRQRSWGVPIVAFYCKDCGTTLISQEAVEAVNAVVSVRGTNAWFDREAEELLQGRFACEACGSKNFAKEEDILDVWFESGSSWRAVVQQTEHLRFPADLYLEGTDQHRGWFQSSLLPSVAIEQVAPFKEVVTHGFVVDGSGQKMSKSRGNFISAEDVLKEVGAEIFRLWVSSIDYKDHIFVDMAGIKEMSTGYRRVRNTIRYLLGSLSDFDPTVDAVPVAEMDPIDRWAVARSNELIRRIGRYHTDYDFHKAYQAVQNYCAVDMSAFYLDVIKDRLYTSGARSAARRSAQSAQWILLDALVRLMAPVLVHTAEEAWQVMAEQRLLRKDDPTESVHLALAAQPTDFDGEEDALALVDRLLPIREDVLREIEKLRADKTLGKSLEASIALATDDPELRTLLEAHQERLATLFIVSDVTLVDAADGSFVSGQAVPALKIKVVRSDLPQCARCWNYRESVGSEAEHPELCTRCVEAIADP